MSLLFRKAGDQFFDANGQPLAGGYLVYKNALTDAATDTWSDSGLTTLNAAQITLDAAGRLGDPVYISTTGVKELLYKSTGELVYSQDDYPGESATSEGVAGRGLRTITGAADITSADNGKLIVLDSSLGSFTVSFNPIADLGTDFWCELYFDQSATYPVTWALDGSETAIIPGGTSNSGQLTASGQRVLFVGDGATMVAADATIGAEDYQIAASVGSNALTLTLKNADGTAISASRPLRLSFRSATLTDGGSTSVVLTAPVTLTLTSGSTLGVQSSKAFNIWALLINDAGTIRLGAYQALTQSAARSITPLPMTGIVSSTAEGGAGGADTVGVVYTGTAVTSKAFTIAARIEYSAGLATAGAWASAPSLIIMNPSYRPGDIIGSMTAMDYNSATSSVVIPLDDTLPQITEGAQVMSMSYTPRSAASVLEVTAQAIVGSSASTAPGDILIAIFRDSTADALAAAAMSYTNTTDFVALLARDTDLTTATTATTLSMRIGPASASSVYFNSNSSGRVLGGSSSSYISVQERIA